jgi:hypothetical protein
MENRRYGVGNCRRQPSWPQADASTQAQGDSSVRLSLSSLSHSHTVSAALPHVLAPCLPAVQGQQQRMVLVALMRAAAAERTSRRVLRVLGAWRDGKVGRAAPRRSALSLCPRLAADESSTHAAAPLPAVQAAWRRLEGDAREQQLRWLLRRWRTGLRIAAARGAVRAAADGAARRALLRRWLRHWARLLSERRLLARVLALAEALWEERTDALAG